MRTATTFVLYLFILATSFGQITINRNLNLELSPDSIKAISLENSLNAFLTEAQSGGFSNEYVDTSHAKKYDFFFGGLHGIGTSRNPDVLFHKPTVLKSYSFDEQDYYITVSFTAAKKDEFFTYKIIELKAVPYEGHYRFYCLFEENMNQLKSRNIGDVTYYYPHSINEEKANEFVSFMDEFKGLTETSAQHLNYYNFPSLQSMLKCYGILFDANKCNFICNDLGFTDNEGQYFITGMNDEKYFYGYLGDYLYYNLPNQEKVYYPMLVGLKTYYGGYGITGEGVQELKGQFRGKLKEQPDIDFLEEFKKGRKSSVNRHFSFYVMCSFLYDEVLEKHGFDEAMEMIYSGGDEEEFFAQLKRTLNIDESNFHESIIRIISS